MATSGRGTGVVGYNVQAAVDAKHHMIVAHEVTNVGHDRTQLASMSKQAREVLNMEDLTVLADRATLRSAKGSTAIEPTARRRFVRQHFDCRH